jgi:L,D-transpeptidase YcbB
VCWEKWLCAYGLYPAGKQHGLNPNDYHLSLLEKYIDKTRLFMAIDSEDKMKLDILLTDAFLFLGLQLYYGKVNIEKEGNSWK